MMSPDENEHTDETTAAFKVYGLDCAEEVVELKNGVGERTGVRDLQFNVLRGRMTVRFDPDVITSDGIVEAVAETGMKAVPWEEKEEQKRGFWQKHGRLILTVLSGMLLVGGFISHWVIHGQPIHGVITGAAEAGPGYPALSVILYVAAIFAGACYVLPKAAASICNVRPDMNLLMTVAVIGAVLIGEWFEAGTVAFLFALALLLEQWSVGRARNAIESLLDLSPETARYYCPHHDDVEEKPVDEINVGDTIVVRPGEKVPLDGEVTEGQTAVNQAPITGESLPVSKGPGDEVYAGTVNGEGVIRVEATRRSEDTTLSRIIHMVEEAESRRAPAEQWVETFARYYTPAMMFTAIGLAILPPLLAGTQWVPWLYRGLVILVISCPCALVISTPVSVVSGLASAARNGVLIKGGVYLEGASRTRALAMDKTGTLTHGEPEVQNIVPLNGHTREEVLRRAAALESHSEHPLARAIRRCAEKEGMQPPPVEGFRAIKGKGGEGRIDGRLFWIGSHRLMDEKGEETPSIHEQAEKLEDAAHSVVALGNDEHVCGLISLADSVRDEAVGMIDQLRTSGVEVVMLTGDNEGTARAVAEQTGVTEYRAELMPEDKVEAVEELVAEHEFVGMVGDGINDAPAMARANFGVAMGAMGTDTAIETADVALMTDDLSRLPWLVRHSAWTLRVIKQNIGFALGLKAVFIILTLFGLASLWMAIAADTGASLLVIFNGLRLLTGGTDGGER